MQKNRKLLVCLMVLLLFISLLLATNNIWSPWYETLKYGRVEDRPGYSGRLVIESVDIDVACVMLQMDADDLSKQVQNLVDLSDCAAMFQFPDSSSDIICDHNYQGFENLENCEIGADAFINMKDGSLVHYKVVDVFDGVNAKSDLIKDGKSVLSDNPGGIILYTCVDHTGVPVHIVFLQPIS